MATSRYRPGHGPLSSSSSSSAVADDDAFDDDDAPLPFPSALPRDDFLEPGFEPVAYLSALLPHRHQTLEDLRGELRDRSGAISAELLELVNGNYTAFLSLGGELKGGGDRVEDVKVALLAFRRQVDDVQTKVRARRGEVVGLTDELGEVREEIDTARKMMDLDERLAALEERLMLQSVGPENKDGGDWLGEDDDNDDDEQEEDDAGFVGSGPGKLASLARDYQRISGLADHLGRDVGFVVKMEERMVRCRNTILLDLDTALKEAKRAGSRGGSRLVRYLAIYRTLDAQSEAIKALKGA